jgi:membrane-associated protease RseP (regulator of RpoE activity)
MVLRLNRVGLASAGLALCSALAMAQQPTTATNTPRPRPLLFGFALECTDCEPGQGMRGRVGGGGRSGSTTAQTNKSYPHVVAILPGSPAERAGIRPGDELRVIDGLSLLSPQGAERLARAAAGEQVQLGFERNAKPISFSLRLGAPSRAGSAGERMNIGYMAINGQLHGDIRMDFWTDQPIYTFPDSTTGTITFQIGTGTIVRMKFTKDSTDPANRRGEKKNEQQWF